MPIEEQIKVLAALQKLDSELFRLKKELDNQPILISNLEEAFKEKESALKKKEDELKALAVKRKEKEMELGAKEEGIKKLQLQLYQLKTNKEYQAMDKEIASQKADVSVIEEEIIRLLDSLDDCTKEAARQKEILVQERKRVEQEKGAIDERTRQLKASLTQLDSERAGLAEKADREFLAKYERILHSKDGLAMVRVEGDACGGCNINLPPQVINEVRMKEELIFCGSCARILYIEEDAG